MISGDENPCSFIKGTRGSALPASIDIRIAAPQIANDIHRKLRISHPSISTMS